MRLVCVIVLVSLFGCGRTENDTRQIIAPTKTLGPYSPAVRVGGFLFLSGQIGMDQATGQLRNESIETETRQALENITNILHAAGYDMSHVVNATVYLKSMNDYATMNRVYAEYFGAGNYPARTTVAVSELPRQANIEIAIIAWK